MTSKRSIPEDLVPVVLEKASRLYQQQQDNTYSLEELMAVGSEVEIPPALMQEAYEQLQQEQAAVMLKAQQAKKRVKIGGAIAVVSSLVLAIWTGSVYNSLSAAQTTIDGKWAQVENQMQRRADLIPQLTQVAQSYANREAVMVQSLSAARDSFLSATTMVEKNAADEAMKRAIAQFQRFVASSTPLQSNELLINLQYEIAGSENRIATERMRYNQAVEDYNHAVDGFPTLLVARLLGFEPQPFLSENQ